MAWVAGGGGSSRFRYNYSNAPVTPSPAKPTKPLQTETIPATFAKTKSPHRMAAVKGSGTLPPSRWSDSEKAVSQGFLCGPRRLPNPTANPPEPGQGCCNPLQMVAVFLLFLPAVILKTIAATGFSAGVPTCSHVPTSAQKGYCVAHVCMCAIRPSVHMHHIPFYPFFHLGRNVRTVGTSQASTGFWVFLPPKTGRNTLTLAG
jgi:hypothetical protein